MTWWLMNEELETIGKEAVSSRGTMPAFVWLNGGKPWETSVRIAMALAGIVTSTSQPEVWSSNSQPLDRGPVTGPGFILKK
jgi:hypothetical protein